jgi:hypothetical protein
MVLPSIRNEECVLFSGCGGGEGGGRGRRERLSANTVPAEKNKFRDENMLRLELSIALTVEKQISKNNAFFAVKVPDRHLYKGRLFSVTFFGLLI